MRRTEMKRTGPPKRKTRLKAESARRKAQRRERAKVVEATRKIYGICQLKPLGDCWGPLDTHEVVKRSQVKDAHLDKRLTINLCRFHNGWVEDHPYDAIFVGAYIKRWAWEQYGEEALQAATATRARMWMERDFKGEYPFWFTPDEA